MKQLLLLRHAKSSNADHGLDDHDRPLNRRGELEAPRVGQYLLENDLVPQWTVSSPACRAHRTAALVLEACGGGKPVLDRRLYLAPPAIIATVAGETPDDTQRLLLVGHNPGIEMLVSQCAHEAIEMKTAHLAVFQFDGDWMDEWWLNTSELLHNWRAREA
jgi:phosphohistidine phosphatase